MAAAQEFSAKAPRVKLDIHLKAPIIIVPQKSTSANALVVDLGKLTLANKFQPTEGRSSDGTPAILDNMKIELAALKISRCVAIIIMSIIINYVSFDVAVCLHSLLAQVWDICIVTDQTVFMFSVFIMTSFLGSPDNVGWFYSRSWPHMFPWSM